MSPPVSFRENPEKSTYSKTVFNSSRDTPLADELLYERGMKALLFKTAVLFLTIETANAEVQVRGDWNTKVEPAVQSTLRQGVQECKAYYRDQEMAEFSTATINSERDPEIDQCQGEKPAVEVWVGISKNGTVAGAKNEKDLRQMGEAFIRRADGSIEHFDFPVSTGLATETPEGNANPVRLAQNHCTTEVHDRPMPFAVFFNGSRGIALHQGEVTGQPASKGCVRVPEQNIRKIFCAVKSVPQKDWKKVNIVVDQAYAMPPEHFQKYQAQQVAATERGGYQGRPAQQEDLKTIFERAFGLR